jgi:hypothetical protein
MAKQNPTQADVWRREVEEIDRRIQSPRTTPEQKEELWRRRDQLFEPDSDRGSDD